MTTQWERFSARQRELAQEDLGFEDNVVIETPTETNVPKKGYTTDYSPEGTFSVELNAPSSQAEQSEGGTTQTADLIAHVPDDVPGQLPNGLDGYGESGEAPVRMRPPVAGWGTDWGDGWGDSQLIYEVVTVDNERNGTLRVELAEVDT